MFAAHRTLLTGLLASSALIAPPAFAKEAPAAPAAPAAAQAPQDDGTVPDVIVTAQKRSESLQNVPISIVALTSAKLEQLNVSDFNSYAALLPSVTFQTSQPGNTNVYIRGVASGGDGNHSGPLPSVGVYLDEQPVTTIGGTIDVHIYDVARIESLAGPQGTLYGASSEAGTLRIITNKPDMTGFYGKVDGEINSVAHGGVGGKLEGFVNVPLASNIAFRAVGWYQRDAGFIDNIPGTRSFFPKPGGITVTNAAFVKNNYNDVEIAGGRAALQIDLDDGWTITPTVLAQDQHNHGSFGADTSLPGLSVQHFYPEYQHDRFIQAALTIQGKLGNWDLTYAGAYFDRKIHASSDYTDYAQTYDNLYATAGGLAGYLYYWDNAGKTIDPRQLIIGYDHFTKHSEEFRVASPTTDRFRVVAGLFYQRQTHLIHQDYQVPGLGSALSVNGSPGTLWLTQQDRVDRDYAMFGEAAFDILPNLTLNAGGRAFIYDNTLIGFFGFGRNPGKADPLAQNYTAGPFNAIGSSKTGVIQCFTTTGAPLGANKNGTLLPASVPGGPCTNLGVFNTATGQVDPKVASGQGFTHKLNLTWKPTKDVLLYATWSRGFRPGGINRRGTVAPYLPDYLTNYEIGFKTTLFDKSLRFNGAFYQQNWAHFQFAYLGQNSFTEVHNGPNARIRGIELEATWTPLRQLTISASGSYTDARTTQNLCVVDDPTYVCGPGNISAAKGTRLPVTPRFKGSAQARYTTPIASGNGYLQAVVNHQSSASTDIRTDSNLITGRLPAFTTADFRLGYDWGNYTTELFIQNAFDERGQLSRGVQCSICDRVYAVVTTPRTIGLKLGAKF
ncbi:TonB-dependent receptor [Sphingomonas sp. AR_OL41]|uniref:TonB-dependent receptor n=1 Tax=Sphingomonas sp. AR_OL41 TaxID=3042729 RepID=UPI0024817268|nr:TonB-dependent receptor [Sphingomonas sp. AR_OL41]MDH7974841.1 TonB-dependent receptor [Sphingomonas sp. AR_OL41]